MVFYLLSGFVILLVFALLMVQSNVGELNAATQREMGQLAAEVQYLQRQVKDLDTTIKVAEIMRLDTLERELRQENTNLQSTLNGE